MKHLRLLPALCLAAMGLGTLLTGCNSDSKKLADKEKELEELRKLAELDKQEMENQYAEFALQYGEMKKTIRDDSLVARLDAEQRRAESLLKELKNVKNASAAEILRLKKELATVREVLKDYIRQVDSLQQLNQALMGERDAALADAARSKNEITGLNERNAGLSEKVAIAAQLNATAVSIQPLKNNGKAARKSKDIRRFSVSFTITRNVTAAAGNRMVYVRMMKPNQQVVNPGGTFAYENKNIVDTSFKVTLNLDRLDSVETILFFPPNNSTNLLKSNSASFFVAFNTANNTIINIKAIIIYLNISSPI